MSETFDIQDIRKEAAQWLSSLHDGEPSESEMAEFDQWMNRSDKHTEVYAQLSEAYYDLDFMPMQQLAALVDIQNANEIPNNAASATPSTPLSSSPQLNQDETVVAFPGKKARSAGSWVRSFAVAASVLAIYVMGQTFLFSETADLMAPQGEIASHQLDDESTVQLNTNTLVNLALTENARNLELLKGEAYFTVAKDPHRPFTVSTGGAQVVALGTEFLVKSRDEKRIRVSVYESSVRVTHPEYLDKAFVLYEGDTLEFGADILNPTVQKLTSDNEIAWREGRLIFNNTPLHEVVSTLNEYHKGRIAVSKDVAQLPISGVFQSIEPVRIMNDIVETQKLASIKVTNSLIYVH